MTSVHALPGLASKIFYFSLVAGVFTFVSMLLLTTSIPEGRLRKPLNYRQNARMRVLRDRAAAA
jgi:hypothetical protein